MTKAKDDARDGGDELEFVNDWDRSGAWRRGDVLWIGATIGLGRFEWDTGGKAEDIVIWGMGKPGGRLETESWTVSLVAVPQGKTAYFIPNQRTRHLLMWR